MYFHLLHLCRSNIGTVKIVEPKSSTFLNLALYMSDVAGLRLFSKR